jgi:hypothetical protein
MKAAKLYLAYLCALAIGYGLNAAVGYPLPRVFFPVMGCVPAFSALIGILITAVIIIVGDRQQ